MRWLYGNPEGRSEVSDQAKAMQPEDVTRIVAERLNAGDAAGVAALYEPQAVLAYPAGRPVTGREAIQAIYQQMAGAGVKFAIETPLPTVGFEDLALPLDPLGRQRRRAIPGATPPARWLLAADHRPARGAPAITPPGRRLETTALVQGCARSRPPALAVPRPSPVASGLRFRERQRWDGGWAGGWR